jgi:hypothetical protein
VGVGVGVGVGRGGNGGVPPVQVLDDLVPVHVRMCVCTYA